MTNKDKYLKDNVSVEEFVNKIADYKPKLETSDNVYAKMQEFFYEPVKPTLTEDERVILRNIDTDFYTTIKKMGATLYLRDKEDMCKEIEYVFKDHLFQFIKERRRIFY